MKCGRLEHGFIIGGNRTADQDPKFSNHQPVEIALRARSPGITDPFTVIACIDHLCGIQIRQNAVRSPAVVLRLVAGLRRIAGSAQRQDPRNALPAQAVMIYEANADHLNSNDLNTLNERMNALNETLA